MCVCRLCVVCVCFFKQKTAYEVRISDWSSDVCSSDLLPPARQRAERDRDITAERDPVRDMELAAEIAGRIKEHGDDPHRLLRVVQPVADRIGGDRKSTRLNSSH